MLGLGSQNASLRESLQGVLDEHRATTSTRHTTASHMTEQEQAMLLNILSFGGLRVEDVMVPRADVVAVEQDESLEEILRTLADAGHSRVPVYRDSLDDPVGMFHIKDLLPIALKQLGGADAVDSWLSRERRPVLFVPPSMAVLDLFLKMQATRIHMALVIDEYGGTDGLVTIEDLVEEIVGEIEDEHDTEEGPMLEEVAKGHYLVDARSQIEDVTRALGKTLLLEDTDEDTDTLGGLIFDMIGRIPQRGELIEHPAGFEFEISDADARRIKKIRIKTITEHKTPESGPGQEASQGDSGGLAGTARLSGPTSKSIREA
jgi:CBS domain containing-hemolysin-like protein